MKNLIISPFFIFLLLNSSAQYVKNLDSLKNIGDVYLTRNILFELGNESIKPESKVVLDSLVTFLQNNPTVKIEISKHCDERVSTISATCLTCNRAKSIESYFISKGISKKRLSNRGYEASKPIITGAKTENQHKINRRTEFKLIDTFFSE